MSRYFTGTQCNLTPSPYARWMAKDCAGDEMTDEYHTRLQDCIYDG